jgi:hypothetical protein
MKPSRNHLFPLQTRAKTYNKPRRSIRSAPVRQSENTGGELKTYFRASSIILGLPEVRILPKFPLLMSGSRGPEIGLIQDAERSARISTNRPSADLHPSRQCRSMFQVPGCGNAVAADIAEDPRALFIKAAR